MWFSQLKNIIFNVIKSHQCSDFFDFLHNPFFFLRLVCLSFFVSTLLIVLFIRNTQEGKEADFLGYLWTWNLCYHFGYIPNKPQVYTIEAAETETGMWWQLIVHNPFIPRSTYTSATYLGVCYLWFFHDFLSRQTSIPKAP